MTREEELIFTALCDRFRSPTQVWQSMSLGELEEATGLAKESLEEALRALRGIDGRDDSRIAYGAARALAGQRWYGQAWEDRAMPDDQFQCDGAQTCPNTPTHVHLGSRALVQLDTYSCDRCRPLAT